MTDANSVPNIVHWAYDADTEPARLVAGEGNYYLRLGAYDSSTEPAEANIAHGGYAEGIFFYTSGIYSLRATKSWFQTVGGQVQRTIQSGNLEYVNEGGSLSITTTEGAVGITASGTIEIQSSQDTTGHDGNVTIKIDAGDYDVYFTQYTYYKETDYDEKTILGYNHKTNVGAYSTTCAGPYITTSIALDLAYSSFSLYATGVEVSSKVYGRSLDALKYSLTQLLSLSVSATERKSVTIDSELSYLKFENIGWKTEDGMAAYNTHLAEVKAERLKQESQAAAMDGAGVDLNA